MDNRNYTKPANDRIAVDIRRYSNRLMVTGAGIMVLGVWSLVKTVMVAAFRTDDSLHVMFNEIMTETEGDTYKAIVVFIVAAAIVLVVATVILSFHFYVFVNASREGRGGKKKNLYLVVAGLMICVSVFSMVSLIINFRSGESGIFDTFVSLVLEVTSFILLVELMHAAVKVRKLTDGE